MKHRSSNSNHPLIALPIALLLLMAVALGTACTHRQANRHADGVLASAAALMERRPASALTLRRSIAPAVEYSDHSGAA